MAKAININYYNGSSYNILIPSGNIIFQQIQYTGTGAIKDYRIALKESTLENKLMMPLFFQIVSGNILQRNALGVIGDSFVYANNVYYIQTYTMKKDGTDIKYFISDFNNAYKYNIEINSASGFTLTAEEICCSNGTRYILNMVGYY